MAPGNPMESSRTLQTFLRIFHRRQEENESDHASGFHCAGPLKNSLTTAPSGL
jgi:hypothetical protein